MALEVTLALALNARGLALALRREPLGDHAPVHILGDLT
jgi:hypothetical protein